MDAACRQADQGIPWAAVRTVDDPIERNRAKRRTDEVKATRRRVAADNLGQLADLAAGNLYPGLLGAGMETECEFAELPGVGALDRDESSSASGSAPTQIRSLTFIATQSIPIVSNRPVCSATITFEPTLSVASAIPRPGATRITLA